MFFISVLNFLYFILVIRCNEEFCQSDSVEKDCKSKNSSATLYKDRKYLLYDVNPGEGFNLRRDVYMRIASVVRNLNAESKVNTWTLVLPPWGPLYHWKSKTNLQSQIKWASFFDISQLQKYIPIIEYEDFLEDHSQIDAIYYLQHYAEGWSNGDWQEKIDIRDCLDAPPYTKTTSGSYSGWFWGYDSMLAKELYCVSVQGFGNTLKKFLESTNLSVVMVDRAEVILHDNYGDMNYWMARRSMVFAKHLIEIGDDFRRLHLNSTDEYQKNDRLDSPVNREAIGGPYVAVHLRRQDFMRARPKDVPSVMSAAQQIKDKMQELGLTNLFVATDGTEKEFQELKKHIPDSVRFIPDKKLFNKILDGGVAIVDQWICANSRYFIGTYESTFSFRIQEEREILGFPVNTTFNRLCGDNQTSCEQPAKWTIVTS